MNMQKKLNLTSQQVNFLLEIHRSGFLLPDRVIKNIKMNGHTSLEILLSIEEIKEIIDSVKSFRDSDGHELKAHGQIFLKKIKKARKSFND